jgi:hypothetical protein
MKERRFGFLGFTSPPPPRLFPKSDLFGDDLRGCFF